MGMEEEKTVESAKVWRVLEEIDLDRDDQELKRKSRGWIDDEFRDLNYKWGSFARSLIGGGLGRALANRGVSIDEFRISAVYIRDGLKGPYSAEYDLLGMGQDAMLLIGFKTILWRNAVDSLVERVRFARPKNQGDSAIYAGIAYMGLSDKDDLALIEYASKCGVILVRAPIGSADETTVVNPLEFDPGKF